MNVYLISGLGADSRAFNNLVFDGRITIHHLNWIDPHRNETMNAYARRLAAGIDTGSPYSIIGLSFGGMLASEMNTFLEPHRVILLSSINAHSELPFYYRWPARINLHKLLPSKPAKRSNGMIGWLFGIKEKKDRELLNDVLANTNTHFSRWAIHALLNWNKSEKDERVIRIHGDRDRVLPITSFKPHHVIKHGGHLMVIKDAEQVSALINRILLEV